MAWQGEPARGNRRLIVISHGSGGSPWVHRPRARPGGRRLRRGDPEHRGDNYKDQSTPGPRAGAGGPPRCRARSMPSARLPLRAAAALDKVGVYGMSAGGHTALSLAGGRGPGGDSGRTARLTSLTTSTRASVSHFGASTISSTGQCRRSRSGSFATNSAMQRGRRTVTRASAAIVAAVPYAADFDMTSLAAPPVSLGLVTARLDAWLVPRFHGDAVLKACPACERIADVRDGGHGALLSPLPPGLRVWLVSC